LTRRPETSVDSPHENWVNGPMSDDWIPLVSWAPMSEFAP
jgi:hypothetical protein